jgi:hypothetical protein
MATLLEHQIHPSWMPAALVAWEQWRREPHHPVYPCTWSTISWPGSPPTCCRRLYAGDGEPKRFQQALGRMLRQATGIYAVKFLGIDQRPRRGRPRKFEGTEPEKKAVGARAIYAARKAQQRP